MLLRVKNMQQLVLDLWIQQNKSFFLITHDIEEALLLSNQLVLMTAHPGKNCRNSYTSILPNGTVRVSLFAQLNRILNLFSSENSYLKV